MAEIEVTEVEVQTRLKITCDTIAEVVEEAVKHAERGVIAIACGFIDEAGDSFLSRFETKTEPYTAEQIAAKLTTKLALEVGLAADEGRTVSRFVALLKLSK